MVSPEGFEPPTFWFVAVRAPSRGLPRTPAASCSAPVGSRRLPVPLVHRLVHRLGFSADGARPASRPRRPRTCAATAGRPARPERSPHRGRLLPPLHRQPARPRAEARSTAPGGAGAHVGPMRVGVRAPPCPRLGLRSRGRGGRGGRTGYGPEQGAAPEYDQVRSWGGIVSERRSPRYGAGVPCGRRAERRAARSLPRQRRRPARRVRASARPRTYRSPEATASATGPCPTAMVSTNPPPPRATTQTTCPSRCGT
jgi:hypothetical protein